MSIKEELNTLTNHTLGEIKNATDSDNLEKVRLAVIGKNGKLTAYLRNMREVPADIRADVGKAVNNARKQIETALAKKMEEIKSNERAKSIAIDSVDITLPGRRQKIGHRHLINRITEEISDVFLGLGYTVATGPEVETDYYNFEALNAPKDHPSRGVSDTFYVYDNTVDGEQRISDVLLRTQTSGVQVHCMEDQELPIYIIAPGKVYRRDIADPSHLPQFTQIEGLVVDKGITFGDLKGTLEYFSRAVFGEDRKTRFRAHYFPFTEPSAEVDVSCGICGGKGCRFCKGTG